MKINLLLNLNETGYGQIAKGIFGVAKADGDTQTNFIDIFSKGNRPEADSNFAVWHHFDMSIFDGLKGKNYLYTFFERDKLPQKEVSALNERVTGIFVACDYSLDVLRNSGYNGKLFKVHPGIDLNTFTKTGNVGVADDIFRFLAVGKWELRKGYDILYEAYNRAFDSTDKVELHIAATNLVQCPGFNGAEVTRQWSNYFKTSKNRIIIHERFNTQGELCSLMNRCDCGVFLSRSEGWNLEVAEMLVLEKQLLISNATSHKEFRRFGVNYVNYDGEAVAFEPPFFVGDSNWPSPTEKNKEELVEKMRSLVKIGKVPNELGRTFAATHSWGRCWSLCKIAMSQEV